LIMTEFLH